MFQVIISPVIYLIRAEANYDLIFIAHSPEMTNQKAPHNVNVRSNPSRASTQTLGCSKIDSNYHVISHFSWRKVNSQQHCCNLFSGRLSRSNDYITRKSLESEINRPTHSWGAGGRIVEYFKQGSSLSPSSTNELYELAYQWSRTPSNTKGLASAVVLIRPCF